MTTYSTSLWLMDTDVHFVRKALRLLMDTSEHSDRVDFYNARKLLKRLDTLEFYMSSTSSSCWPDGKIPDDALGRPFPKEAKE